MQNNNFDLDTPLMTFLSEGGGQSDWTIRDSIEGTQVFGSTGAGKTSSTGRLLAHKFMKAGYGGLVLTVKEDEADLFKQYASETGRQDDLVIIEPGGATFNFMDYESTFNNKTYTQNLVNLLSTVIQAGKEQENKGNSDEFWSDALLLTLTNVIELTLLAYSKVDVQTIYDIFLTAPRKDVEDKLKGGEDNAKQKDAEPTAFTKAYNSAGKKIRAAITAWEQLIGKEQIQDWKQKGVFEAERQKVIPSMRVLGSVYTFFIERYRTLSDRTRSIVDFSFMSFLSRLLQDPVYSLFCSQPSTVVPEDSLKGKIIIVNLPVKLYDKVGRDSQILFKLCWQRAMERRTDKEHGRPVFLWVDESQFLLHPKDTLFQTTARASRVATVYLTQNISNYHANMGGNKSDHFVHSFLGTLGTKFFHANTDLATNSFAASLIGDAYFEEASQTTTVTEGKLTTTNAITHRLEKVVRPEAFVRLLTGSPKNNFLVEAYIHKQGTPFPNKMNHRKILLSQKQNT